MATSISAPVSTALFLRLADFLREGGSDIDPAEAVETAIEYWLENASWKPELYEPREKFLGYFWKPLLLPPGTQVRMKYKGATHHASVEGDDFIYENRRTTPSEFANGVAAGTARNAWRDLWIKRPGDADFVLADTLRRTLASRKVP